MADSNPLLKYNSAAQVAFRNTAVTSLKGNTSGLTLIGGTSTTADLTLQTTSGVGATGADMHFLVGNNGATEAMTILNNGRVGIGTTGPGSLLHVYGGASGGAVEMKVEHNAATAGQSSLILQSTGSGGRIWSMLSADTAYASGAGLHFAANGSNFLTISAAGNVGIGTTGPNSLLEVAGKGQFGTAVATTSQLTILGGASGGSMFTLSRTSGATVSYSWALAGGGLSFSDDTNGVITTNIYGDSSQFQLFLGLRGKGSSDAYAGLISGQTYTSAAGTDVSAHNLTIRAGAGTGAGGNGHIAFHTKNTLASGTTAQTYTERMRVEGGTGNVGIGSTSPAYKLQVQGTSGTDLVYIAPGTGAVGDSGYFNVNARARFGYDGANVAITDNGTSKPIIFSNASVERMRIDATGNVGIGATSSGSKLQINTGSAGTVGQIIHGAASQTADLQRWQNSAATILSKVDSSGQIFLPSTAGLKITGNTNVVHVMPVGSANTTVSYNGFGKYLWHDLAAFAKIWGVPEYETKTSGGVWSTVVSTNAQYELFSKKENQTLLMIDGVADTAARWTWKTGVAYSFPEWFILGITYVNPMPTFDFLIETSADSGANWTTRHTSTGTGATAQAVFCGLTAVAADAWIRLTITVTNGLALRLSSIKAISARWGDQGKGSETEYPYQWDAYQRIGIGGGAANTTAALQIQTSAATTDRSLVIKGMASQSGNLQEWQTSASATLASFTSSGTFGIGITPTAVLHLKAGTATASTAPLKFTSGTNLTTAEAGAMEYNGTNLFFTRAGTTREGVLTQSAVTTEAVTSDTTVTVNIGGVTYKLLAKA